MTQIGPRFTQKENLQNLTQNRTDNKVNLSKEVDAQTLIEDVQGALNSEETNILVAQDVHQGGETEFVVLSREEAQNLLSELQGQEKASFTMADIKLPESTVDRHESEVSNQTAELVKDVSQNKDAFDLKLTAGQLSKNAIHLDRHYGDKQQAVQTQIDNIETQIQNIDTRIAELQTGDNPSELTQLNAEKSALNDLKGLLQTQHDLMGEMATIKYSWNKQPTAPETLQKLETLNTQLQTQIQNFQTQMQTSGLADTSPYLSAQLGTLGDKAQHMSNHVQDCLDYCQDPEMMSARALLGKDLNFNAVMRDYENTLDLIAQERRKAPAHMPQETHDLQGFKNATLNSVSYSQAYQKVFGEWNQEIDNIDFQSILEAPDAEEQIEQLRTDLAAKIDKQFTGPDGYTIKASKVEQVKQLFDDHLMSAKAEALAQKAGNIEQASQEDVKANLSPYEIPTFENGGVEIEPIASDNTRVENVNQTLIEPEFSAVDLTPAENPLNETTQQAAIDNQAAKNILPTLTGVVPSGFGDPAEGSMQGVYNQTQNNIGQTQTQIQTNHGILRDHYKAGNLELDGLPEEVRTDLESDFISNAVQDNDIQMTVAMTNKDWPPLSGVRENSTAYAAAYQEAVDKMFEEAEIGSDAHTFMRCMQAMELYNDPEYKDDIDYDQLQANIKDLQGKLTDDFQKCADQALEQTFGTKEQRVARAEEIKKELLSDNFLQRLSVLPNSPMEGGYMTSTAQMELNEAMSLIHMLNPDEDLSSLSQEVMKGMITNNPAAAFERLPAENQHQILDESQALFEALDPETQQKILADIEKELDIKPQQEDPTGKVVVDMTSNVGHKPADLYAKYLEEIKNDKHLLSKVTKNGFTGAFGGLLAVGTMAYSGVGFDANTAGSMASAIGAVPEFQKVVNTLGRLAGQSELINVVSEGSKFGKFAKAMGPIGEAISLYSNFTGAWDDFANGDTVGGTMKGIGAASSAATLGAIMLGASATGPFVLVAGAIGLIAWGLDAWLGESEQETIIRQAGCEKEKPLSQREQQELENIKNPYYIPPGPKW